jgi:hypothetical protein
MTLVNGIWYDNVLKGYPKKWNKHYFENLSKNSEGIPIVKCSCCGMSRMWIMTMEELKID